MKHLIIISTLLMTLASPIGAQNFKKGIKAYQAGDYTTAIMEWRPLAMTGNSGAQFLLGATYEYGHGVIQDYREAAKWYRLAAEQGHSSAQYYIGLLYESGRAITKDNTRAYMWFNISASNHSDTGKENMDRIAKKMTPLEISMAQTMASNCMSSNYKKCDF
jgi:TPR repeat protein